MACFHCEHQRPPDEYMESQMQEKQPGPLLRAQRAAKMAGVTDAWNFDFDDNESDGAEVAAFEFADPSRRGEDSSLDSTPHGVIARGLEEDSDGSYKVPRTRVGRYFSEPDERKSSMQSHRTGFDDFDDEEDDDVDSYELDTANSNRGQEVHRKNFSEVEQASCSEDFDDDHSNSKWDTKNSLSGSEDDDIDINSDSDDEIAEGFKSKQRGSRRPSLLSESDDDDDDEEGYLHSRGKNMRGSRDDSGGRGGFRSDDRLSNRRNSFGNSGRGSHRYERGSQGEWRENDRFQRLEGEDGGHPRQRQRINQFSSRSRDTRGNERGSRNDGYGGGRRDDGFRRNTSRDTLGNERGLRTDGYGGGRGVGEFRRNTSRDTRGNERGSRNDGYGGGRGNDGFRRNTSRDTRGKERGSRNEGYEGGRGDDGFRGNTSRGSRSNGYGGRRGDDGFRGNGRNDRFSDQSRSFVDGDDDNRPRRVIER